MVANDLPTDIEACHLVIAKLQSQLDQKATELSLKSKLVEEQAHSVLQLKENNDRLDEKVAELNRKVEALLQQLYGRKSERRIDGVGQLLLALGEEVTPEVVSALEEAIRDAEQIIEDAEQEGKKTNTIVRAATTASFRNTCLGTNASSTFPKTSVKD